MKYQKIMVNGLIFIAGLLLAGCNNSTEVVENSAAKTESGTTEIVMYKSPSCDCCSGWAKHLREAGFTVIENKRED
ncbi:MAG: hypothetical protein ACE5DY_09355, partial [Mariprofundaceae bacterium]